MTPRTIVLAMALLFAAGRLVEAKPEPVVDYTFAEEKEAGPQPPLYPEHDEGNTAKRFGKKGDEIILKAGDDLKFGAGDSITMEAWVKIDSIGEGHMPYLIGKGRHDKGTTQNYAMRLQNDESGFRLGFLFSGVGPDNDSADQVPNSWHRWWSSLTFPEGEWHHVAIVYTFGEKDSLRAYIDGRATDGTWDLGGKSDRAPVSDDSDIVIGTGYTRGASQTFHGWLDNVRIWREALPEEELLSRFEFVPPPPPITREMLTPGEVLVQISEKGVPASNDWPLYPEVTETYDASAFGFFDWPEKYVGTGVRGERSNPSHFRASAMVEFPPGKHRILLRGRGATRLYIDGKKILENKSTRTSDGHKKLSDQDTYLDLGPDFRFRPPGNNESWVTYESSGGEHFVILESMIGGIAGSSRRRPEFGETVAAVSLEGEDSWWLLGPGKKHLSYTDEGWEKYEAGQRKWLTTENLRRRKACREEHSEYWAMRREKAKQWLASTDEVKVPELPRGLPANNAIDHFIGAKIEQVKAEAKPLKSDGVSYFDEVQPLLEAKCYDCHRGSKIKGGLRLDTLAAAQTGGKSDGPAVVAGDVDDSALIWRIRHDAGEEIMPPKGDPLTETEINLLTRWIEEGAHWPEFNVADFTPTPLSDDLVFLRRLAIDTVGVPPDEDEIRQFLADPEVKRRELAIDRFLRDERWADNWMGYWQDVLAENPNMINPTLNNTGPFRWWIYESLIDNKPLDLFVTELVRMEGSDRLGGPRGFGTASGNDVPMAAKGIILSGAFLGVEMKCARCHDAPGHEWMQEDLFEIASMLKREGIKVPMTSSVPMDKLHERSRKPLIQVTLEPGSTVEPDWPFPDFVSAEVADEIAQNKNDSRDRFAALLTAPQNERFAQVMANRIWQRFMGRGIVETVHDWEKGNASHPELLRWLGRRLVEVEYDMREFTRIILSSHAYQRATDARLSEPSPLFIAPAPRRLEAEQIIDSLFSATGTPFDLEEVSLDIDGSRDMRNSITLGKPRRAWMLASTSNERDRPSLSLPKITAVTSVMETFGWRGARQDPQSFRDTDENVLQPAIIANGTVGVWLTRLSDRHGLTALALEKQPVEQLVERMYMKLLTRLPSESEKKKYVDFLSEGYENRIIPPEKRSAPTKEKREPRRYVSWSNHLDSDANALAVKYEEEARAGDPPTNALETGWRLRMEDAIWALINSSEWIYTP
ncbi:MAG: DUF1553 domain-containing protein [Verrucomicrobiales bacterium]|nr:DUF1553 domain-containing protein [Verrucomicrobiales bacterium]